MPFGENIENPEEEPVIGQGLPSQIKAYSTDLYILFRHDCLSQASTSCQKVLQPPPCFVALPLPRQRIAGDLFFVLFEVYYGASLTKRWEVV
jgi:hypothetical protein